MRARLLAGWGLRYHVFPPRAQPEELMAEFYLYADESGKTSSKADYVSFCGYIAHVSEWQRFSLEWNNCRFRWGIPTVHMARIMAPDNKDDEWRKIKNQWGADWEAKRDLMLDDLAATVRNAHLVCVGVATDAKHFRSMPDSDFKRECRDPVFMAFHHLVMRSIERASIIDDRSPISIVIDDGDEEYAIGCYKLLNTLKQHPHPVFKKVRDRIDGMCFGNDRSYPGIQAADMVAYEARRLLVDRIKDPKAEPSKLLHSLTLMGIHQPGVYTAALLDELASNTNEAIKKLREDSSEQQ